MPWLDPVVIAIWSLLPAYIPNNAAVLFGGGRPIDGGRTWRGARLLGDGKTWRGAAAGIGSGVLLATILTRAATPVGDALGVPLPEFPAGPAIALPAGAIVGDATASFCKRRLGRERGAPALGLDQYDLVVGALAVTAIVAPAWTVATFTPSVFLAAILVTPLLHLGTNVVAHRCGLKDEPW